MMDTGRTAGRNIPAGVVLFLPFVIAVVLLSNFGSGSILDSSFTFMIIGGFSLIALMMAKVYGVRVMPWFGSLDGNNDKKKGFRVHDVILIFIGLGGLLLAAFVITPIIPGVPGILVALSVGGLILGFVYFKSGTWLVPWFSHTAYNMVAYIGSSFSLISLSSSPIFVPLLNLNEAFVSEVTKNLLFQWAGVALGEELLKICAANGIALMAFRNPSARSSQIISYIIATAFWVFLHTALSYPLR